MATIKHSFTCGVADDPNAVASGQVVPSNWNADHVVEDIVVFNAIDDPPTNPVEGMLWAPQG